MLGCFYVKLSRFASLPPRKNDATCKRQLQKKRASRLGGPAHAPVLKVAPIDVGGALAEKLWPDHTAVLTSATIPASLAIRVGIPDDSHDELDAGSPFDFATQALLYCATHMPDPRNDAYRAVAPRKLIATLDGADI